MRISSESGEKDAPYLTRACPGCGGTNCRTEVASAPPAESESFPDARQQWYGFYTDKRFFSFARCQDCGQMYCPTYFTQEQLAELYASMPNNMAEVSGDALEATQGGYASELMKRAALDGSFLEIGPDTGLFAGRVLSSGRFDKAWFFEPNVNVHEALRGRAQGTPSEISTALLDLDGVPDGSVSVAAMIHVLDHILEPLTFLRALRAKLRPDAHLLIVTHDERSVMSRVLGKKWPAFCPQHPQLFNRTTIAAMLGKADLDVIASIKSRNVFSMRYLAKHGMMAVGIRSDMNWVPPINIGLRLGNTITIAGPSK